MVDDTESLIYTLESMPRQQTSLVPLWPNVDHVGSTLSRRGPNVACYLGFNAV